MVGILAKNRNSWGLSFITDGYSRRSLGFRVKLNATDLAGFVVGTKRARSEDSAYYKL
jgi:hypothetical protein